MLEMEQNHLARDAAGRYYVYGAGAPYVWVFDPEGKILRRIGRSGKGPGEFTRIASVVADQSDSVFVYDASQARVSVFSPALRHVRTFPLQMTDGAPAFFVGHRILARGGIRTPDRIGYPLHLVTRRGEILRSFGSATPLWRSDLREVIDMRSVAPADAGAIWVGWWNQYLIESWDTTGVLRRAIKRDVDWFELWWTPEEGPQFPPVPVLTALQQQGDTLWILVRVPDTRWRSAVEPVGRTYRVTDQNEYLDTMIEAIDLRTLRILASSRVPAAVVGFVGPRLVYGQGNDRFGNPLVPVWELRIIR